MLIGVKCGNLYKALIREKKSSEACNVELSDDLKLWHERLAHVSKTTLVKMQKLEAATGLDKYVFKSNPKQSDRRVIDCESCCLAKHSRTPIPLSSRPRATENGQFLHMDILGPIGVDSLGGGKSIAYFKDEFSNYRLIYVVKSREEVYDCVRKSAAQVRADTGKPVLTFVSDCGSELTSNRTQIFFEENNIFHKTSAPHQTSYAQKLVKRFELEDSKVLATPMKQGIKYISTGTVDGAVSKSVQVPYREALGGLMYLATGTRPDLSCAVAILARFCNDPKLAHWTALKDVLRYVNSTINLGIRYHRECQDQLIAYSDSDYASDVESRKSMTGMLIKLNNGPIVWKSTKQTVVAESTAEAEFVACSATSREVIWCQSFLRELGVMISMPTPLLVDNQSAIRLVKNNQIHSKIKQLDIRLMAVSEREANKQIEVSYVNTEEQQADMLTKALARPRFVKLRQLMGMSFVFLLLFVPFAVGMRLDLRTTTRGPVRNKIKLQIKEPCALIEETELEFLGKVELSEEYKANLGMITATRMLCKKIFDQHLGIVIKELNGCLPHDRSKRWVAAAFTAAKAAAKVGDVVLGVTNMISSIHEAIVGTDNRTYEEMTSRLNQTSHDVIGC